MSKALLIGAGVIALAGGMFFLGQSGVMAQMTGDGHMAIHERLHGQNGVMQHDMTNMPGLRGLNATPEESAELAVMFNGFQTMTREVTNLENGIRTVTSSSDPEVMNALVSHVGGMIGRVETLENPQIMIQSPTLDIFFMRGDKLVNDIEITDAGIVVTQTSDDPEMVAALQKHASEVSRMAESGMDAVHEMMMERASQ